MPYSIVQVVESHTTGANAAVQDYGVTLTNVQAGNRCFFIAKVWFSAGFASCNSVTDDASNPWLGPALRIYHYSDLTIWDCVPQTTGTLIITGHASEPQYGWSVVGIEVSGLTDSLTDYLDGLASLDAWTGAGAPQPYIYTVGPTSPVATRSGNLAIAFGCTGSTITNTLTADSNWTQLSNSTPHTSPDNYGLLVQARAAEADIGASASFTQSSSTNDAMQLGCVVYALALDSVPTAPLTD